MSVTFPVLATVIVYAIRSPPPIKLSELLSVVTAVFITSIDEAIRIRTGETGDEAI